MPSTQPAPGSYWYTGYKSSDKARHIHSINIHGYNTWDDWHLIPSSRPVVNPPEKKRTLIDIPGRNGNIDESDSLRKFPIYGTRQGSWEFYVDNDWGYWESRRTQIADAIHGIRCTVSLDDDPSWYYTGTIAINEWRSEKDWSRITLDYDLDPYKMSFVNSLDRNWKWDPFNFDTDHIYSDLGIIYIYEDSPNDEDPPEILYQFGVNQIPVDIQDSSQWLELVFPPGYFSRLPVSPVIHTSDVDAEHPIKVKLRNPELGITPDMFGGGSGNTAQNNQRIPNFTLSSINRTNEVTIYLTGVGTVSFEFRAGRL